MNNETDIVILLEKAYFDRIYGRKNEKSYADLILVLRNFVFKLKISEEYIDDVISQSVMDLLTSFDRETKFWKDAFEKKNKSSKEIVSYVFQLIKNAFFTVDDNIEKREKRNLLRKVTEAVRELTDENFLATDDGKYFLRENAQNITGNCAGEIEYKCRYLFWDIYNSNGTLNAAKLKESIKKIFTNCLDKCKASLSYIKEIIKNFAVTSTLVSLTVPDEDDEYHEMPIPVDVNVPVDAEVNNMTDKWISDARKKLGDYNFTLYGKLYLLRFWENNTFQELAEIFHVSKSSVENYVNRFIAAMNIRNDIDVTDPKLNEYLNTLHEKLLKVFNMKTETE